MAGIVHRRKCSHVKAMLSAALIAAAINASVPRALAQEGKRGATLVSLRSEDGTRKEVKLYAESWALVIGVRKYMNGWTELDGAEEDMKRVSAALKKQGFEVETLPDPTRDSFNQAVERFINEHGSTGSEDNRLHHRGH